MFYDGYCYSCGFDGVFKSKTECPQCRSSDIIIYTDDGEDYYYDYDEDKKEVAPF